LRRYNWGEDDDSNYVVGMSLDLTGCGGPMMHPADRSRPRLPQGPLVLVATADAKLAVMRLGNLDEAAAEAFAATCIAPATADVPAAAAAVAVAVAAATAATAPAATAASSLTRSEGRESLQLLAADETLVVASVPLVAPIAPAAPAALAATATPAPGGFGAAFLQKASSGYAASQKALQDDLDKAGGAAAPVAGGAAAFGSGLLESAPLATAEVTTSPFSVGGGSSTAAAGGFSLSTAAFASPFGAPASPFGVSLLGAATASFGATASPFGAGTAASPAASLVAPAYVAAVAASDEKPPPAVGFGAAFLAKASSGYAASQGASG
jgi:nuclear pore complex protein Nup214